jgi:hypothetical protein
MVVEDVVALAIYRIGNFVPRTRMIHHATRHGIENHEHEHHIGDVVVIDPYLSTHSQARARRSNPGAFLAGIECAVVAKGRARESRPLSGSRATELARTRDSAPCGQQTAVLSNQRTP